MTVSPDIEIALLRRRKADLLKAKLDAVRNDGLAYYRPHAKQVVFHSSDAKRRGVFAGNRFGKSRTGGAEDCAWLRGERTWFKSAFDILDGNGNIVAHHSGGDDHPLVRSGIPQRPVKGLIFAATWDKVSEVFTNNRGGNEGILWRFLPRDGFVKRASRNHEGVVSFIECANGSTVQFATVKSWLNDPNSVESAAYDFIHVDEPCPEGMWKGASRGLVDTFGSAWFTLTSLSEPWITDAFLPGGSFDGSAYKVEGSIYDNPYLSREAIALFEQSLTPDERECRLYGKPLHLAGLVYKEFKYDRHVLSTLPKGWRSWSEPPKDWSYYYYIDPHPRVPHTVLFLCCDPFGRRYVFHDIFERCHIRELCKMMDSVFEGRHVIRGRMDPLGFIEDPETGKSWADTFASYGYPVEKAVKDPLHGISRVQQELSTNPGFLFFTQSARRTLWEIQRFHWDEETNKPVDKDDHACECLYRAILDEPCYVDPKVYSHVFRDESFESPRFDLDREPLTLSI